MQIPDPLKALLLVGTVALGAAGAGHAFDARTAALDAADIATVAPFAIAEDTMAGRWRRARDHARNAAGADHWRAFQDYARIAATRYDEPSREDARYVGGAMREMGRYYLVGIEGSPVVVDPRTAESYLYRAASLFGDADAQFELGRFYLDARWGAPRRRHAARWLALAARKGHHLAQSELGALLCEGNGVARNPSRGIVLMATALRNAPAIERAVLRERLVAAFAGIAASEREHAENALRRANLPPVVAATLADGS